MQASRLFEEHEKKKFVFMHCFDVLGHHPKWQQLQAHKKQKTSRGSTPGTSRARPYAELENARKESPEQIEMTRPMGCKAAKAQRRRGSLSTSSGTESVLKEQFAALSTRQDASQIERKKRMAEEVLHRKETLAAEYEMNQFMKQIEMEKLELKRKEHEREGTRLRFEHEREQARLRLEQRRQDDEVMKMDLSNLDDDVQEYYRKIRKKILHQSREDAK